MGHSFVRKKKCAQMFETVGGRNEIMCFFPFARVSVSGLGLQGNWVWFEIVLHGQPI